MDYFKLRVYFCHFNVLHTFFILRREQRNCIMHKFVFQVQYGLHNEVISTGLEKVMQIPNL